MLPGQLAATCREPWEEPRMSFELPAAHRELLERARETGDKVRWRATEADAAIVVDPVMREALQASGLVAVTVPAAHGGTAETVDPLAVTVVREAFGGVSAHLDSLFAMQGIGSYALSVAGSPRVQEEWLPRVLTVDAVAALCLTEPDVGSDLRSITTTVAERDGELVLDGHKSFITNAPAAAFFTVLAKEDAGFSLVFVPADRKSTRLNSSHANISYAVFCLKKKKHVQ